MEQSQVILKKLDEAAREIVVSQESLREFIKFASRFYRYSSNNQILIHHQNKFAQFVASETYFRKEHQLEIAPNQKPMEIIVPIIKQFYKDEGGDIRNIKQADEKALKKIEEGILSKFEHNIIIKYMETDKDHIHYMIETEPIISISKVVNLIKSYTTYHIWKRHTKYLKNHFWKEHTFWTDGYFACSVGNVSEEMLKQYIENQG